MTEASIVVFPIMALICWGMAVKVLTAQRPFLYNGNWGLGIMALAWLPQIIPIVKWDIFSDFVMMAGALVMLLIYVAGLVVFAKLTKLICRYRRYR